MQRKPKLHFLTMCNSSNGGFDSAITLINALKHELDITVWSLFGPVYPGHEQLIQNMGVSFKTAEPVAEISNGDHVIFYMNEYPLLFSNFSEQWKEQLPKAASVQIAFNRFLGSLCEEHWLADIVDKIHFQSTSMREEWHLLTQDSQLNSIPCEIQPPPVILDEFLKIPMELKKKPIIGRLAGDTAVPSSSEELYETLSEKLPEAEFWFMPAPEILEQRFSGHSQFRFFAANDIPVIDFFKACDIYLLTYADGVPIPGPRSLSEAMASGCAPIVVNRDGPKDRVIHGECGYCADTDEEIIDFTVTLVNNPILRVEFAQRARERAMTFQPSTWINRLLEIINHAA